MARNKLVIPIVIVVAVIAVLIVGVLVYPKVQGLFSGGGSEDGNDDGNDDGGDDNQTTPNKPPNARLTIENSTYEVGMNVHLSGNDSTDDKANTTSNGIVKYTWDFGDGSTLAETTDPEVDHVYLDPGNYNITLTVWDEEYAKDSDTGQIRVVWAQETISLGPAILLGEPIFSALGVISNSTELSWEVKSEAKVMNVTITVAGADFRATQANEVSVLLLDPNGEVRDNKTVTVMGSTQIIWEYLAEDLEETGEWMLRITCDKGAAYISVQGYVSYI